MNTKAGKAKKADPFWIHKSGAFALAIPGDEYDGWYLRLRVGRREFDSGTRFVRLRDAERAAAAIWQMLLDGP